MGYLDRSQAAAQRREAQLAEGRQSPALVMVPASASADYGDRRYSGHA
jgi:hypothetical protein